MKRDYEAPEICVISLISDESIMTFPDAETGVETGSQIIDD